SWKRNGGRPSASAAVQFRAASLWWQWRLAQYVAPRASVRPRSTVADTLVGNRAPTARRNAPHRWQTRLPGLPTSNRGNDLSANALGRHTTGQAHQIEKPVL